MKYLKKFSTHSEYNTYIGGGDKVLPNISYCVDNNEVHYNPWVETRLVTKFNVTSTSGATTLCNSSATSQFSEIEIDGIVQPSVVSSYTFDTTGEHTVKYTLTNPTNITNGAFAGCTGLTSINIPNSVTSIGDGVFSGCSGLTNVVIGSGVTSIGGAAFAGCTGLTSITIPNSVTTIGYNAFRSCSGLTSITIPNSVTSIGDYAFYDCSGLTSVTLNCSTFINNISGYFALIFGAQVTEYILGNGVTTIPGQAFGSSTNLINIIIPDSVTTIGNNAFIYCNNLTSVTIGRGVTSIGTYAFQDCTKLENITSLATTAPTIGNETFKNVKTNGTLTVPSGSTGYDVWMGTGDYYLGKYNWTKVEQ